MRIDFPLIAALALGACVAVRAGPVANGGPVALHRSARVGDLIVTPQQIEEDSRCAANVQCIWRGRVILGTRIEGAGWREDTQLTMGQPHQTHGTTVALVSVEPQKQSGSAIGQDEYRFTFAGGR